jgi:hypothetical protein
MRKALLFLLLIVSIGVSGQNIREIFMQIPLDAFPSSRMMDYLKDKREYLMTKGNIITSKDKLKDDEVFIDLVDEKNGYIKFTALRGGDETQYELCYWKTKDGHKLVGLNYSYCDVCCCGSTLFFYDLVDNKYIKHKYPSPVMDKLTVDMFLDVEKSKKMAQKDKDITTSFDDILENGFQIEYELPRIGTSIIARINSGSDENMFVFKLKEIVLEWDGSRFKIK